MKRKFLPCSLLCMFLAATTALGDPGDAFYEANLSLTRAVRQEKEGDYKAALESGKKAAQLLQSLKTSAPEWNPEWVAGKLDTAAQLQRRVEPLAQKAGAPKKADYSLRPGEQRDFTLQRAYKAHERQKTVVGAVPVLPSPHGTQPGKTVVPASASRPEIRSVKPAASRPESISRRTVPSRGLPPRMDRDRRFRIGS
ncbi:hypothetical protein [Akkermansia sp.]|uniref:hypothetical protein n=1 Tax=Akkermansia sp. TaxID=1872421 RepID=UPI0025C19CF7|nr:hypothetical protein [Akkermansia sp.]MCD8272263.1 hypothetical protein [Akkermansia sp.]